MTIDIASVDYILTFVALALGILLSLKKLLK